MAPQRRAQPAAVPPTMEDMFRAMAAFFEAQRGQAHVGHNPGNPENPVIPAKPITLGDFKKLTPPQFKGTTNPTEAEAWIQEMEKIFAALQCSEEQKVIFAVFMLQGEANNWWEAAKRMLPAERAGVVTWPEFLKAFNEKYFPMVLRNKKMTEFLQIKQGDLSVSQYEAKFAELYRYASHLFTTDEQKAMHFEHGLKPTIRTRLTAFELTKYSEVMHKALRVEQDCDEYQQMKDSKKRDRDGKLQQGNGSMHNVKSKKNGKGKETIEDEAQAIGTTGTRNCPHCGKNHGNLPCYRKTGACFECGQQGHRVKDCPKKANT